MKYVSHLTGGKRKLIRVYVSVFLVSRACADPLPSCLALSYHGEKLRARSYFCNEPRTRLLEFEVLGRKLGFVTCKPPCSICHANSR